MSFQPANGRVAGLARQAVGLDHPLLGRVDHAEVRGVAGGDRQAVAGRVEPGDARRLPGQLPRAPRASGMTPVSTSLVIATASAVSTPSIPGGASSNGRSFVSGACGAWSVAMASIVPSAIAGGERGDVGVGAQRRVHLEHRVEGPRTRRR